MFAENQSCACDIKTQRVNCKWPLQHDSLPNQKWWTNSRPSIFIMSGNDGSKFFFRISFLTESNQCWTTYLELICLIGDALEDEGGDLWAFSIQTYKHKRKQEIGTGKLWFCTKTENVQHHLWIGACAEQITFLTRYSGSATIFRIKTNQITTSTNSWKFE